MSSTRPRYSSRSKNPPRLKGKLAVTRALAHQLAMLAERLDGLYSCCVTAEHALRRQNADYDVDIARCLRFSVSDPASKLSSELREVSHGLTASTLRRL